MLSSQQKLVVNIISENNGVTLLERMEALRNNTLKDQEKKYQN